MRPGFLQPLAVVAVMVLLLSPAAAQQTEAPPAGKRHVDVALVLAADVSRSITGDEFQLQRQGYAKAIADPEVVKAIEAGAYGAIALTFVEWAGSDEQEIIVDWRIVHDGASARQFAAALLAAPRAFYGRTSISAALDFAMARLKTSGVTAQRRVIDVSGDGTNNAGRPLAEARAAALAAGVTINGLAIVNHRAEFGWLAAHTNPPGGLPNWYRANVTGGQGSFLLTVKNFASFGDAMTRKLLSEIAAVRRPEKVAVRILSRISP